jgi:SWI/SNF-related matrix-associated actin-dependent regulator of chromatin subfamily B protein 1
MSASPPVSINAAPPSIAPSPSTALPNGAAADKDMGAVAMDAPVANGVSPPPARDLAQTANGTIEERKQKAKAIVAASTRPAEPTAVAAPSERVPYANANGTHANGSAPSRKRSRSGTRLQNPPPAAERPVRTKEGRDAVLHEQYFQRDLISFAETHNRAEYQARELEALRSQKNWWREFHGIRDQNPAAMWGPGYAGYGNGFTDIPGQQSRLIFPQARRRPAGRKARELYVDRKDRATQAEEIDDLVPIRLDIEWDKIRLRDTFTWNLHDRVVSPELFAEHLVEDFRLPLDQCQGLVRQVAASIEEQVLDYHPHIFIPEEPLDPHLPYFAHKNDEMRITIKLNIIIGQHTLMDQFEWEINDPMNLPEEFARQMATDLSLGGEFATAIAHSIREQSQLFTRSLYATGHPFDGRPIEDHELQSGFLPSPLPSTFRPYQAAKDFTPYLFELNEADLEKTELSLSREERRQKRSTNRRGGPALPDLKDRRRTIRTLVVSSVLPDAAGSLEESRIFKRSAVSGKGRRSGLGHRDGEESDESESDGSVPGSPAVSSHLQAGTARTRNMRGAATAAQVAMRAGIARSATPESVNPHHHETRTSGRRVGGREYRETSSPEPQTSLIVKLRIPRLRFQQVVRDQRAKSKEDAGARPSSRSSTNTAPANNPGAGIMGPPSTTPRAQSRGLSDTAERTDRVERAVKAEKVEISEKFEKQEKPEKSGANGTQSHASSQLGRIDAAGPPSPEHPIVSCPSAASPY